MKEDVGKYVLRDVKKELNWIEKIVLHIPICKEIFIKAYRKGMVKSFNYFNKY